MRMPRVCVWCVVCGKWCVVCGVWWVVCGISLVIYSYTYKCVVVVNQDPG